MYLPDETEKSSILGRLIKDERKRQKKSAAVIAGLSGISQQYISEIERNKKPFPAHSIRSILAALSVDFSEEMTLYEEADLLTDEIIDAFVRFDRNALARSVNLLLTGRYRFSFAYDHYLCAHAVRLSLIEKKPLPSIMFESGNKKLMMLQYLCLEKPLLPDAGALTAIQRGMSYYAVYEDDMHCNLLYAVLLYDLSDLFATENRIYEALKTCELAQTYVLKYYYPVFSLSIDLCIATLLSRMGQYRSGTEKCLRIISQADILHNDDIRNAARYNLASNYMVSTDYNKCVETTLALLADIGEGRPIAGIDYLLAFSYYMLDEISLSKKHFENVLNNMDASLLIYRIAEAVKRIIDKKCGIPDLLRLYEDCLDHGDHGDITNMYYLLNKYLVSRGEFQTANDCAARYIAYIRSVK